MRTNYLRLVLFLFFALFRCPMQLMKLITVSVRTLAPEKGILGLFKLIFNKDKMMETLKK